MDLNLNVICASAVDDTSLNVALAQSSGLGSKISTVLQVVPMPTCCFVHQDSTLISPFLYMDVRLCNVMWYSHLGPPSSHVIQVLNLR
jgi:hypothetical protein